jgi:hypothetical protein
VVDSLRALAAEVYGSLLLPEGTGRLSQAGMSLEASLRPPEGTARRPSQAAMSFGSAAERQVMEAIKADPGLPFSVGSGYGDWVSLMTSTGRACPVLLEFLGFSLIGHAWDLARLREAYPSAEVLLGEIPAAVAAARAAFTGTKTTATGLVSLGGVVLPAGSELSFTWGQLRPVREGDHPREVPGSRGDRRLTHSREDGAEVVITDGGDIMLVAAVPFAVRAEEYDPVKGFPDESGVRELRTRILQAQLALLLAWPDHTPPALLPFGARFIEPLTPVDGFSWNDLHDFTIRLPAQLTPELAAAWRGWIERIDDIPLRSLGEAPHRLVRATSARGYVPDVLTDAVIAWESLVGTRDHVTRAVSEGIAKLLRPPGEERSRLRARVREIYDLRSSVVHGRHFDSQDAAEAGQEACGLAADVLRALIADRPDLVPMTRAERSARILRE